MIYLDNAASSFPKPRSVYRAAKYAAENLGANPGRSGHKAAMAASGAVYEVREKLAEFFNLPRLENVVFTANTTHALNIAINSAVKSGSRIITSVMEHNAVLRPLYRLQKEKDCGLVFFKPDMHNVFATVNKFRRDCEGCDVCVMTACSNVNGYRLPLSEIGEICREKGIAFIVDGAQGAGYFDIDMQNQCIDMLCVPSQKGLYGLCGAGALLVGESWSEKMTPLMTGGSGVMSQSPEMPPYLPERLEAGTISTVPIITMGAGVDFVKSVGTQELYYHAFTCAGYLRELLMEIKDVNVYPSFGSIVLFNVQNAQSDRVSQELDDCNIAVRSGFHCAPCIHEYLNTGEYGAVRASFGAFNTPRDAEYLVKCIKKIKIF